MTIAILPIISAIDSLILGAPTNYVAIRPQIQDLRRLVTSSPTAVITEFTKDSSKVDMLHTWAALQEQPMLCCLLKSTFQVAEAYMQNHTGQSNSDALLRLSSAWEVLRPALLLSATH